MPDTRNRDSLLRRSEPCAYCGGAGVVEAERNFLLERRLHGDHTWVGMSSDAMVNQAIQGFVIMPEPGRWPADKWDLARCEETYRRAPAHLRPRMYLTLKRFRRHVEEGGLYCKGCDNSVGHTSTRDNLCGGCWDVQHG